MHLGFESFAFFAIRHLRDSGFSIYLCCLPVSAMLVILRAMSTLAEIEKAIESLSAPEVAQLAAWLERRQSRFEWPVPPPNVPQEELDRIEAEIEAAFPTRRN